jgi:hypothetical protein
MKLDYPGAARPDPWDRNPNVPAVWFSAAVAPHGTTQRLTYTVPVQRKTLISGFFLYNSRLVVATTDGDLVWTIRKNGVAMLTITLRLPTANQNYQVALPSQLYLAPGDSLEVLTSDSSTGGQVYWSTTIFAMEFDA